MEEDKAVDNDKSGSNRTDKIWYLFICVALVLLIVLMLPRKPAKPVGGENEVNVTEATDTPIEMAGMDAFKANHRVFASAVAMYAAEHNGENAQSIYDLSDYVNVDEVIGNPPGATYDISVDFDNNLTLTSTFDGEELVYTN